MTTDADTSASPPNLPPGGTSSAGAPGVGNSPDGAVGPPPWLRDPEADGGRLEGWGAWHEALRGAFALVAQQPADLLLFDEDFAAWPLGEKAVVGSFERWALQPGRAHATLLAVRWDAFARQHPRWLRWRAAWAHRVTCKGLLEEELSSLQMPRPMLLIPGRLGLQLLDPEHGVGLWTRRPAALAEWRQLGDAISQRSADAMPDTTLGL